MVLYEGNAGIRQIFTDGRSLPANDPQPFWFGYSTGTWVGNTLVAETRGLRDGEWLDVNGSPLTDAAKMMERLTRVNYGNLDTELIEFVCLENEKSTEHFR